MDAEWCECIGGPEYRCQMVRASPRPDRAATRGRAPPERKAGGPEPSPAETPYPRP